MHIFVYFYGFSQWFPHFLRWYSWIKILHQFSHFFSFSFARALHWFSKVCVPFPLICTSFLHFSRFKRHFSVRLTGFLRRFCVSKWIVLLRYLARCEYGVKSGTQLDHIFTSKQSDSSCFRKLAAFDSYEMIRLQTFAILMLRPKDSFVCARLFSSAYDDFRMDA